MAALKLVNKFFVNHWYPCLLLPLFALFLTPGGTFISYTVFCALTGARFFKFIDYYLCLSQNVKRSDNQKKVKTRSLSPVSSPRSKL